MPASVPEAMTPGCWPDQHGTQARSMIDKPVLLRAAAAAPSLWLRSAEAAGLARQQHHTVATPKQFSRLNDLRIAAMAVRFAIPDLFFRLGGVTRDEFCAARPGQGGQSLTCTA